MSPGKDPDSGGLDSIASSAMNPTLYSDEHVMAAPVMFTGAPKAGVSLQNGRVSINGNVLQRKDLGQVQLEEAAGAQPRLVGRQGYLVHVDSPPGLRRQGAADPFLLRQDRLPVRPHRHLGPLIVEQPLANRWVIALPLARYAL
jgi:hypothetical protein